MAMKSEHTIKEFAFTGINENTTATETPKRRGRPKSKVAGPEGVKHPRTEESTTKPEQAIENSAAVKGIEQPTDKTVNAIKSDQQGEWCNKDAEKNAAPPKNKETESHHEPPVLAVKSEPDIPLSPALISHWGELLKNKSINVADQELILAGMAPGETQLKMESDWLELMCATMQGGLRLISIRKGIILRCIKAIYGPSRNYEKEAVKYFPHMVERTRRYCLAQATDFLALMGIEVNDNSSVERCEAIKKTWTLSFIIKSADNVATKKALELTSASIELQPQSNPRQKKAPSEHVRLDTFRKNTERLGHMVNKVLTLIKKLSPEDFEKAEKLIEKNLPSQASPFYLNEIANRKSTPVVVIETKNESAAPVPI